MPGRPGDRKRRWQQSYYGSAFILFVFGAVAALGIDGTGGLIVAGWFFLAAFLDYRDGKRGWKLKYELPRHAYREMNHPNPMRRKMAREAAAYVLQEAKNPNRKKYAFQHVDSEGPSGGDGIPDLPNTDTIAGDDD